FLATTRVDVGGTAAVFTVTSDTEISVTVPAHAPGTVNVSVTTAGGPSPRAPAHEYTFAATPSVDALSASAGNVAGGNTVTLTGRGCLSTTRDDCHVAAAEVAVICDTKISVTVPAHAPGTVNVSVTTAGGTSSSAP